MTKSNANTPTRSSPPVVSRAVDDQPGELLPGLLDAISSSGIIVGDDAVIVHADIDKVYTCSTLGVSVKVRRARVEPSLNPPEFAARCGQSQVEGDLREVGLAAS